MKKSKLALVTCYFQPNYGSQLQAYATQLMFDKLGVDNETICIDGLRREINNAKYLYFLSKIFDRNTIVDKMATARKIIAKKTKGKKFTKNLQLRTDMFKRFEQDMFRISKCYNSKSELTENAYSYNAFVVGSDQLWLPSNIEADYYTLNFVPNNVCKIAFATSFGVSELPRRQAQKASKFLKRIDYISVREKSGQKLIKNLSGREVPIVCDPTLMFTAEDWNQTISHKRIFKEPYLFCYFLGNNPEQREWVKKVKKETGFKIVQLQHCDEYIRSDEKFPDEAPYNIGPKEFVQLIRDAEYVFTDSFHCSVFSMLFSKKFFTFRRYNNDSVVSTNSRIYSLLSLVHLEERLLRGDEDVKSVVSQNIDYMLVHGVLEKLRSFSYNWIKKCLTEKGIL